MSASAPIGVFDSGVGGLSVVREIRRRLPAEDIVYFADSANCPYGGRPLDEIRALSLRVARELLRRGAKAIVVACNSASGAALESLRETLDVPVVGLEPALKPAVERSRRGRVGVMATSATLGSDRFDRLTRAYAGDVRLVPQACPGLVELVEEGEVDGPRVEAELREILAPLLEADVDTVVLGCTHYPFLREPISRVLGSGVEVLDSGEAVARQVERVLRDSHALAQNGPGTLRILTSGESEQVTAVVARLWPEPLPVEHVDL